MIGCSLTNNSNFLNYLNDMENNSGKHQNIAERTEVIDCTCPACGTSIYIDRKSGRVQAVAKENPEPIKKPGGEQGGESGGKIPTLEVPPETEEEIKTETEDDEYLL